MYSSEKFGRLFWVDEDLEFRSCPMFVDGSGDFEQRDYVSDWEDWSVVNLDLIFNIYKVELLNKLNHTGSLSLDAKNNGIYSWIIPNKISFSKKVEDGKLKSIDFRYFPEIEEENYLDSLSEGKDKFIDEVAKGIVEDDMSGVLDDYGSKVDALVKSMGVTDEEVSTTHRRRDLDLV